MKNGIHRIIQNLDPSAPPRETSDLIDPISRGAAKLAESLNPIIMNPSPSHTHPRTLDV
jgi:hypothetical protein